MNFDPSISSILAIGMSLLAAFMWGSWFISLKHLSGYPLEAFYLILFSSSIIFVWGMGLIIDGRQLTDNIISVWQIDRSRVWITFLCGILYVTGMLLSLYVIQMIGLTVSQPIYASVNVIGGTALSAVIGGVPEDLTVLRIALAVILLTTAVLLSVAAGSVRNKAQKENNIVTGLTTDPGAMIKGLILLIIGSLLIPAYTVGLSYGLRSITQPAGLAPLPFMVVLSTGAFIGAAVICSMILTVQRNWHHMRMGGFLPVLLGVLSGLAHYGGNIIHTFATRNLSAVVSWPLGFTAGLWTQMWGLVYGEFKGSPAKGYWLLGAGVLCYILGAMLISNFI